MSQYKVFDDRGKWLFDIWATSKMEAMIMAKKSDHAAARVEFKQFVDPWKR